MNTNKITQDKDLEKKFPNNFFKAYGSKDGSNVCDISYIEHFRDNVSKGFKLKFEFTNDGFKTKKAIMLERQELLELLLLLKGDIKSVSFKRKEPLKSFSMENQGTHSFIKYNQSNIFYTTKLSKYDELKLLGFLLTIIQKNFKKEMSLNITKDEILNMASFLSFDNGDKTSQNNYNGNTKNLSDKSEVGNDTNNIITENKDKLEVNSCNCSNCGKLMSKEKEQKVIDFSLKKYNKILCLNCQKL